MTQISENIESNLIRSNLESIVKAPLRKSGRVPHHLDKYYHFLIRDGDPIELDENDEDPITYIDAIQRSDSDKWLDAMKFKIEYIEIIGV